MTQVRTSIALLCALILGPIGPIGLTGCMTAYKKSQGGDTQRVFHKIFATEFNTAWQSTLDALKSYRLDVSNREGGFLQTRWTENTAEKAFIDSYGPAESFLKAQFRFRVTVATGFFNGTQAIKVSVMKEQLIQRDVLEGWKAVETDTIDENTLLYRIGRLVAMRTRIQQIEDSKAKQVIEGAR